MKTLLLLSLWTTLTYAQLIRIPIEAKESLRRERIDFNPDHFHHPHYLVGYVEKAELSRMSSSLRKQVFLLDGKQWAIGAYDRETFEKHELKTKDFYEGYHDYAALTSELKRLVELYPKLITLKTAGQSVQGRELWYVIVTEGVDPLRAKPKFIYHANMHGDEVVGRELMIYLLRHLTQQYGRDPIVTQILKNAQVYVMPSMNPDGFELRTRENAHGRDLNRNFPDRFDSPSDTPSGREIEVQRMMQLAKENHFVFGMNWHGGEICFNLPWGNISNHDEKNKHGDDSFFAPIGREYTSFNSTMYQNDHDNFDHGLTYGYEWYPVNGGINDWYNFYRRSLHAVVELSFTKWPQASTLNTYWDSNRDAMITYLWRGMRGVHLELKDTLGNLIATPTITVAALPKRPLTFDGGTLHRLTGDGRQTVTISAPGFQSKTIEVDANYFDGTFVGVTLDKNG